MELKKLYEDIENYVDQEIELNGWIRNHRKQKEFGFIDFSDGTCFKTIQIVYDTNLTNFDEVSKLRVGCAINMIGKVQKSLGGGQSFEVISKSITLLGEVIPTAISPK